MRLVHFDLHLDRKADWDLFTGILARIVVNGVAIKYPNGRGGWHSYLSSCARACLAASNYADSWT